MHLARNDGSRMTAFAIGDRVSWHHTKNHIRHGTIHELDTNTTAAVQPDDDTNLLYLNTAQLVPGG
jgi:hypothetical protein